MDRLVIDCGVVSISLPGGMLRFNPADPNLYARFLGMEEELDRLRQSLEEKAADADRAETVLAALQSADQQFKALLRRVFGEHNDFDRLLEGINLLAVGDNGLSVGENLLQQLEPVLAQGAQRFTRAQTQAAVEKARQRRACQ